MSEEPNRKSYVRQFGERTRVVSRFRMLPDIAGCTTYGMKGTLSEMELSTLRQRSLEALRLKASRGELFLTVAVGYVKVGRDRIAKDPDERGARGDRSRVPQVRGVPEHPPGPPVAAAGGRASASRQDLWRGAPHRLEAAGLRHRPQALDQPHLRRRLRVRPDREPRDRRERTQAHHTRLPPRPRGLGRVDPPITTRATFAGRSSRGTSG